MSDVTQNGGARPYNKVTRDGINQSNGTFRSISRNNGFKILYDDNVLISNVIGYEDYITACADEIGGQHILHTGRMPGGVVIFVKSVDIVERVCASGLMIQNVLHSVEPLVKPAIKMIISNCPPYISDDLLKPFIETHGKMVSPIKIMSANFKREDLMHVNCFRRYVFILPKNRNDMINVRESIVSGGSYHSVFFSTGAIVCFKCNMRGHRAVDCHMYKNNDTDNNVHVINEQSDTDQNTVNRKTNNANLIKKSTKTVADGVRTPTADKSENSGTPQAANLGVASSGDRKVGEDVPAAAAATESVHVQDVEETVIHGNKNMDIDSAPAPIKQVAPAKQPTAEPAPPVEQGEQVTCSGTIDKVLDNTTETRVVNQPETLVSEDTDMIDNIINFNINIEQNTCMDEADNLSICSDFSHISEMSIGDSQEMSQQGQGLSLTQPTKKEVLEFFMQIKNSKKQIVECTQFCPDLRMLHNVLFSVKDAKALKDPKEKVRLRTLMKRIKTYIAGCSARNRRTSTF